MAIFVRPTVKTLAPFVIMGAVLLLVSAGCGSGGDKQVTGLVLEAVERSLTEIESLRLRDEDGRVWEFSTRGPVGTSAAHLRQHQVGGDRVKVTYVVEDGRFLALDVVDASAPGG